MTEKNLRIIISGGGTGGHIFPAVSIANAIKELHPEADIPSPFAMLLQLRQDRRSHHHQPARTGTDGGRQNSF